MTVKIKRIDHIDIIVQDVAAAAAFYEAVGFTRHVNPDFTGNGVQLRFPGDGEQPLLELYPVVSRTGAVREPGLAHIALAVDDLAEAAEGFAQLGLQFDGEPRRIPASDRLLANLIDPDGRKLQFVETD